MSGAATGDTELARARLVPELIVSDIRKSLAFWCDLLGFQAAYGRTDEGFAYLDLAGAQIMLEERNPGQRQWITGELEKPFGRGTNFQVEVENLNDPVSRLTLAGWPLYMEVEERWYGAGPVETGQRQCLVQDPDGYLVRLCSSLGQRPAATEVKESI